MIKTCPNIEEYHSVMFYKWYFSNFTVFVSVWDQVHKDVGGVSLDLHCNYNPMGGIRISVQFYSCTFDSHVTRCLLIAFTQYLYCHFNYNFFLFFTLVGICWPVIWESCGTSGLLLGPSFIVKHRRSFYDFSLVCVVVSSTTCSAHTENPNGVTLKLLAQKEKQSLVRQPFGPGME